MKHPLDDAMQKVIKEIDDGFRSMWETEQITRKSVYEYRCCKCKVKRKTAKRSVAKKGVCSACVKKRIMEEEDKRQIKLF